VTGSKEEEEKRTGRGTWGEERGTGDRGRKEGGREGREGGRSADLCTDYRKSGAGELSHKTVRSMQGQSKATVRRCRHH